MPIPDFQSFMLPVLELASDGKEHSLEEARDALAKRFGLTDAEREELLPSGRQRRFDNQNRGFREASAGLVLNDGSLGRIEVYGGQGHIWDMVMKGYLF